MWKSKVWFCIPPIVLCLIDSTITLIGQSAEYWQGNYELANEGCPPMCVMLQMHPLAFEGAIFAWIFAFVAVLLLVPRWLGRSLSIAILLGHTWGTYTWLEFRFHYGYWTMIALFLFSGLLTGLCFEKSERVAAKLQTPHTGNADLPIGND